MAKVSRNSREPWFWVVTKLPKLGFGMLQSANLTGIDPDMVIDPAVRLAETVNATSLVRPTAMLFCPSRIWPDAAGDANASRPRYALVP